MKDKRTRVENNLLGNKEFCPMIRKTPAVLNWAKKNLIHEAITRLKFLSPVVNTEVLGRSVSYLYTKETKSSTEIEGEDSREDKTRKFFRVLKNSGTIPLDKMRLIFVQNQIVNSAYKDDDYRAKEIYVGVARMTLAGMDEDIHFIGPKAEQVPSMMNGLLKMHEALMADSTLPDMMHAALISFGLVYIHPFSDGNGRTHRYLIHDVVKSRSPEDQDFIIPVSAAILQNPQEYDKVLETLSRPIMAMIDYDLDDTDKSITINNDLSYMYRYPDLTPHVEFLYKMMDAAINIDLLKEVFFILKFDTVKKIINKRYDLPNKELDLLVQLLLSNNAIVGKKKRKRFEEWLKAGEFEEIELIAAKYFKELDEMERSLDESQSEDRV